MVDLELGEWILLFSGVFFHFHFLGFYWSVITPRRMCLIFALMRFLGDQ